MLLRAMGLYGDPSTGSTPAGGSGPASADQLATFVLPSLMAGDGSGAAEIAAAQVPAILGTGNETQFQFQGVDQQPEAVSRLACSGARLLPGLLRLGIRQAQARLPDQRERRDAYTVGKHAVPEPPAHSHSGRLRAHGDLVCRCRLSVSGEHGRVLRQKPCGLLRPRRVSPHHAAALGGRSTLSQALRIAATLMREEIGGVNPRSGAMHDVLRGAQRC